MVLRLPRSTLFPYTTLFRFRSISEASWLISDWMAVRSVVDSVPLRYSTASSRTRWSIEWTRSEEHTSELQSHVKLVCRLLLEKKKKNIDINILCVNRSKKTY